jgi:hypothetical protein
MPGVDVAPSQTTSTVQVAQLAAKETVQTVGSEIHFDHDKRKIRYDLRFPPQPWSPSGNIKHLVGPRCAGSSSYPNISSGHTARRLEMRVLPLSPRLVMPPSACTIVSIPEGGANVIRWLAKSLL